MPPKPACERPLSLFSFLITNWCIRHTSNKRWLKGTLKKDQRYTKKKEKRFVVKLVQSLALAQVDTYGWKFLFPGSLGEIFSSTRKNYQIAYELKK